MNRSMLRWLIVVAICILPVSAFAAIVYELSKVGLEYNSSGNTITATVPFYTNEGTMARIDSVDLTSPTKTVPLTGASRVVKITSDANQTGALVSGGVAGQEVRIFVDASDNNTVRFDDNGTTLALGGNITLGATDSIDLFCYADGLWICTATHDN